MVAENGDVPQHNGLAALRTATFSFQLNIHKPLRSPIWYRELDDIIFNRFDDLVHGPYPTAALVWIRARWCVQWSELWIDRLACARVYL